MTDHNTGGMSESEEMYLITIANLVEQGVEEPVPISLLAQRLAIQPVSVNQMVHKLAEAGLVDYQPYKGVELTQEGRRAALRVLRHRRLWEVFLADHLHVSPGEADALACRLEHITPKKVIDSLADFLGHPGVSPQGFPIPEAGEVAVEEFTHPLASVPVGQCGEVISVEADEATYAFLNSEGIRPGCEVRVLGVGSGGAMLVTVGPKRIHLADAIAGRVMVRVRPKST